MKHAVARAASDGVDVALRCTSYVHAMQYNTERHTTGGRTMDCPYYDPLYCNTRIGGCAGCGLKEEEEE